eukprot:364023-Chlamydomonas_euryale.AAC.4
MIICARGPECQIGRQQRHLGVPPPVRRCRRRAAVVEAVVGSGRAGARVRRSWRLRSRSDAVNALEA